MLHSLKKHPPKILTASGIPKENQVFEKDLTTNTLHATEPNNLSSSTGTIQT